MSSRSAISLLLCACVALGACASSAPPQSGATPTDTDGSAVVHGTPGRDGFEASAANTRQAALAFERGRYQDAVTAADEALQRHPFELQASLIKIESHLALGENSTALDFAERLSQVRERSADAHYARGKVFIALRRSSLAIAAFERALELAPDDVSSKLGLLAAMAHVQRYDLSFLEGLADEIARAEPALELSALHQLAIASEQRGDLVRARALYERAVRGGDPLVHYNLARLLHETVGLAAARPHYERFLAHDRPAWRRERAEVKALTQRE